MVIHGGGGGLMLVHKEWFDAYSWGGGG
jgi:hypothetical protein